MARPEPRYRSRCVERFLEYVTFDTQSEEGSSTFPSTAKQLDLLRRLVTDLHEIGIEDAVLDEHGYVFATIPATSPKPDVPVIGFAAHVDTSPEMSGAGVRPIVRENYDGRDLAFPDDPAAVLKLADNPELERHLGDDLITASGTTLLGADDKAGVAAIVGAAEVLMADRSILHGPVRLAFTPDEEIGLGTRHFDVGRFGASCAYTLDGGAAGELQSETFSADALVIVFHGFNTHPGYAKGRMVNAIKVAADFLGRLPAGSMSPETTAGHEGYVHPYTLEGGVERVAVRVLLRDFRTERLADQRGMLERLAREAVAGHAGSRVEFEHVEQYRNMRVVLEDHPRVVAYAEQAVRRAGLELRREPIRGGTDGSRLSFMGLPTPNLFTGEHNFHSRLEWASAWEMRKAVEVIVELCKVWEEQT